MKRTDVVFMIEIDFRTNGLLFFIENLTTKLLSFQFLFENMSKQITVKCYSESELNSPIKQQKTPLDMTCLQQKLRRFYQKPWVLFR